MVLIITKSFLNLTTIIFFSHYLIINVLLIRCIIKSSFLFITACLRVTVDGGTAQWDNFLKELPENVQKTIRVPDLITGDFDSIPQEILQKYEAINCKVIHTPDQNHTDFTKALMELNSWCKLNNLEIDHVITICQSSGRLDHIMGNIQTLFLAKEKLLLGLKTRLYLVTDDSISWLLQPGDHIIKIPEQSQVNKRAWCSLIPVGETCSRITTSGLKWNLESQSLKFGEIVSTSNTFDGSEHVTVKCSNTVLWSMKVPTLLGE
ncbi:unnamed protein product [Diatraea saccharalis]|uniref:Thiamine pyrophosphokinase 1 n=1 Tax=Diatraea saccharalis TaxID=40085 RepID=A0A9N9RE77_9NEOP|nr:unnamed protein product [Diatraea saccharalis]